MIRFILKTICVLAILVLGFMALVAFGVAGLLNDVQHVERAKTPAPSSINAVPLTRSEIRHCKALEPGACAQ